MCKGLRESDSVLGPCQWWHVRPGEGAEVGCDKGELRDFHRPEWGRLEVKALRYLIVQLGRLRPRKWKGLGPSLTGNSWARSPHRLLFPLASHLPGLGKHFFWVPLGFQKPEAAW